MAGQPSRLPPAMWRLLVVPPLSCVAKVVTHLPGFDGPLPFYLETGYVAVNEQAGIELFYYFVKSERDPAIDPVILWLTAGPGCSGLCGLVFEVGPVNYMVVPYNGTLPRLVSNPYSWTKVANFLYLDNPAGVGFSYARNPKGYDGGDYLSSLQAIIFLKKVTKGIFDLLLCVE
uniref:Uncharacterized protein n=1 Tax=Oryza punctata TaxID=4537 RepID=A0A0E0KIL4_ORYPU